MKYFEYKTEWYDPLFHEDEEVNERLQKQREKVMQEATNDGWELVSAVCPNQGYNHNIILFFKRQVEP